MRFCSRWTLYRLSAAIRFVTALVRAHSKAHHRVSVFWSGVVPKEVVHYIGRGSVR